MSSVYVYTVRLPHLLHLLFSFSHVISQICCRAAFVSLICKQKAINFGVSRQSRFENSATVKTIFDEIKKDYIYYIVIKLIIIIRKIFGTLQGLGKV